MAIDAKIDFIRNVEDKLANKITVSDMATIMSALNDVMQGYEMRSVAVWEDRTDVPVELLDKIGMQLCEKSGRSISHAETTI